MRYHDFHEDSWATKQKDKIMFQKVLPSAYMYVAHETNHIWYTMTNPKQGIELYGAESNMAQIHSDA